MLDPLQQAFETEMKAKAAARPRPAATRRAEKVDNSSAPGAAELGRRIQAFLEQVGFRYRGADRPRRRPTRIAGLGRSKRYDRRPAAVAVRRKWRRTVKTSKSNLVHRLKVDRGNN